MAHAGGVLVVIDGPGEILAADARDGDLAVDVQAGQHLHRRHDRAAAVDDSRHRRSPELDGGNMVKDGAGKGNGMTVGGEKLDVDGVRAGRHGRQVSLSERRVLRRPIPAIGAGRLGRTDGHAIEPELCNCTAEILLDQCGQIGTEPDAAAVRREGLAQPRHGHKGGNICLERGRQVELVGDLAGADQGLMSTADR